MMQKMRWLIVVSGLVFSWHVSAQDFTRHNWYFGNSNAAIRFNRSDNAANLVTNQKLPFGNGGSAVASNPINADLMFYTDGSRVYDISGVAAPMTNGTGLLANTSGNQPVAICPVPPTVNFDDTYYIFTNSANGITGGTILVSTVDMKLPGNSAFGAPFTGEVTTTNQTIGLPANSSSEAMIIIPHDNGTDYWLITHQNGSDNYTVTHIQPAGVFTHSNFPNLTGGLDISALNFAYHPPSGKIAVTPFNINRNVAVLNFDNATGALTFDQFILNSASTIAGALYDTEWSPTGRFLYISRLNDTGTDAQVLQFDSNSPLVTLEPVLPTAVNRSYGLQLAPDSTIYHLYQQVNGGPFLVARLTDTDSLASLVQYEATAFAPNPNFNGRQFPSFSPVYDLNLTISFTTAGTCSNSPISFYPSVTPAADSVVWNFGDGNALNAWSPVHTYDVGGTFDVTLTAFLNGESESTTLPITITQFDLQLTLVSDTTACECELPVNNGIPPCPNDTSDDFSVEVQIQGGTPISIVWSNGDTGPVLTPDSAGYYYVVVTDATGCQAHAGVNVREYGLEDQRANIWYFGQNAGIDFNVPPPVALNSPINSPEGVAVISNRNGQVILSTDGVRVFDRNDVDVTQPPIPPGLGGESGATQSALIIPVPDDETLYYIFTTQEVYGTGTYELRYSLFDIKLNNGDGGLLEYNRLLFSRSTERITGNANWLIAHEYGNNSFRAYRITNSGILNPVISSIGSDHVLTAPETGQGYMKLGGGNVLAVALSNPGVSNVLEIFDFNNATGAVTNFRTADLNSTTGQVYGVEFAGNKILTTLLGTPSAIREFYIDFQGNPQLITPPLADINQQLGAIQRGPDGQIYVAINNSSSLGVITINPDTLLVSSFNANGFALAAGTQSTLGLPNFIQNVGNPNQPPGMDIAGFCLGEPTLFTGFGTDPIDLFEWSFGDGFGSDSSVVRHTYAAAGDYIVTLRVYNRCGLDTTMTQTITIFPPPSNPTFLPAGVLQPVICNGDLLLEALPLTNPNIPNLTYLWSTGETTREILVSQQSIVSVTITNIISGCTSAGALLVADNRPPVDLGPDQTLCQNSAIFPLDASNPGAIYAWTINGVASGTAQTQPVDSSVPGSFTYQVSVTDPITACTVTEEVTYTFNEAPAFTAVPSNTAACGTNTGQIALTINSPASLFTYFVTGPSTTLQDVDQNTGPVINPGLTALGAGTYSITVADQISGCASITTVGISDNAIDIVSAIAQSPTCDPVAIDVITSGIVGVGTATYTITNSGTGVITIPATLIGTANFTTLPVTVPGSYTIQVNADGCVATEDITLVSDPIVPITLSANGCVNPVTLTVTGGSGFSWTGPNITSSTNIASVTATPPQGSQTYTVTVTDAGFCPATQSIVVEVNNNVTADFTQTDGCADQITLTATVSQPGSYTYQWDRNGIPIPGGVSILANLSDNGASYRVSIRNTVSGCTFLSPARQVNVAGDLQLVMNATTPCEGSPFTLTATSNIGGTSFQWAVDGNNISGATNSSLIRTTGGLYRVTGTVPGCSRSIENQILLFPTTPGALPQRALICNNDANPDPNTREITLDAGAGFISYNWFQGGVPIGVTTQTLLVDEPGVYSVALTNSFGCISNDQTDVIEECRPRITAPTAFRPGSSVVENSEFGIFTFFIDDTGFEVFIFNRWGEMIYQSTDRLFRWNGGYKNNPSQLLPAGTYTYVVKYKSAYRPQDGIQEKRGGVVLVR
ncbi:MAG: PKD domain-containing protein [Cyclobacteriaceae bacterium]|nr:PKD domain-containing protein [Cyclobacteriaceae bacterium]